MPPLDAESTAQITGLIDGIQTAFSEYKNANDARLAEIEKKGTSDPVVDEKLAKIDADMDKWQAQIDEIYAKSKRRGLPENGDDAQKRDLEAKTWAGIAARKRQESAPGDFGGEQMAEYKAALIDYWRKGDRAETKALSVGSDPDGGYLVTPDMSGRIVAQVYETSEMRQFASVQTISTDSLEGISDLDQAGAGWVGETGTRSETTTPQLDTWRIPVHEMYAAPRATQKILDDASLDVEAWLGGHVARRFARLENAAFVSGTGVDQPRGFTTYPDGTTLPGTIEQISSGANADFAADPNGADALIDMVYGLKAPYRANGRWFMNRATTGRVRKMQDSNGAYIWQPTLTAGQPPTLLGYPAASFEDMVDFDSSTGALAVAFGDMREAYQIVDRFGVRVLRDPYTAKPYVEFYTTKRVGGDVINFEAIKILAMTA